MKHSGVTMCFKDKFNLEENSSFMQSTINPITEISSDIIENKEARHMSSHDDKQTSRWTIHPSQADLPVPVNVMSLNEMMEFLFTNNTCTN